LHSAKNTVLGKPAQQYRDLYNELDVSANYFVSLIWGYVFQTMRRTILGLVGFPVPVAHLPLLFHDKVQSEVGRKPMQLPGRIAVPFLGIYGDGTPVKPNLGVNSLVAAFCPSESRYESN